MKSAPSREVKIYIAGDIEKINDACRKFCLSGLCVTVTSTSFIFTGGLETGAAIGLINYPRFPAKSLDKISDKAVELAKFLLIECHQRSCTVVAPTKSHYIENESIVIPR